MFLTPLKTTITCVIKRLSFTIVVPFCVCVFVFDCLTCVSYKLETDPECCPLLKVSRQKVVGNFFFFNLSNEFNPSNRGLFLQVDPWDQTIFISFPYMKIHMLCFSTATEKTTWHNLEIELIQYLSMKFFLDFAYSSWDGHFSSSYSWMEWYLLILPYSVSDADWAEGKKRLKFLWPW